MLTTVSTADIVADLVVVLLRGHRASSDRHVFSHFQFCLSICGNGLVVQQRVKGILLLLASSSHALAHFCLHMCGAKRRKVSQSVGPLPMAPCPYFKVEAAAWRRPINFCTAAVRGLTYYLLVEGPTTHLERPVVERSKKKGYLIKQLQCFPARSPLSFPAFALQLVLSCPSLCSIGKAPFCVDVVVLVRLFSLHVRHASSSYTHVC